MRALGASEARLYRQAATEGLRVLAYGIIPGVIAAVLAARVLRFYFLGFRWFDGAVLAAVPLAVLAIGMVASVAPVHVVLRQTPLTVLRDP
jgi:predicted lysophospholipase L1 biosynthesis ABC-type transport system permease subunit